MVNTQFTKGQKPWNKGKSMSRESKEKLSNSLKGKCPWNKGIKTGIEPPNKGKKGLFKHSPESIESMRNKLKGRKSPNYKCGYKIDKKGYIHIWVTTLKKYILEHRHIIEKYINRPLKRSECVHHIDGNKQNNNIKNLKIMSWSEHSKHHQKKVLGTIKKCSICFKLKKLHSIKYSCCRPCYVKNYLNKNKP